MTEILLENAQSANMEIKDRIAEIMQRHTGYSADQIKPGVEFESDLGIDSVTLASVVTDIYKALGLSDKPVPAGLLTLEDVMAHVDDRLMTEANPDTAAAMSVASTALPIEAVAQPPTPAAAPAVAASADAVAEVREAIIGVFHRHTGYGSADLAVDAEIEGDLGIDSVTLASVLEEIPGALGLPRGSLPDSPLTIADVISAAATAKSGAHQPTQAVKDAPVSASVADAPTADPAPEPVLPGRPVSGGGQTVQFLSAARQRAVSAANQSSLAGEGASGERVPAGQLDAASQPLPSDDDRRTMKDFINITDRDLFHKTREFRTFYRKKQDQHLYWYGMPLESRCANRAVIFDEITGRRREFLMFASNNYLGLANDPKVIEAIGEAAHRYGATNTGCRLIGGSNVLHKELEERLAAIKGREACIVYPSGYSANLGCISALVGRNDIVFTDAINHMSIQDGCKLAGAPKKIFQHSMESLERTLQKYADHEGGKLIVTDGVFSMHGDIVDLPKLVDLARRYNARVLVDDAHSTGVLGRTGSGTTEHFGMKGAVDLELGTMSKALGGLGGFVCGDEDVVEYLRFYSNSYVFAATIPAHVAAGLIKSIDLMVSEPYRLAQLWSNIHRLRAHLLSAGFDLEQSESAIIPVVVGDDRKALEFGRATRARGMFCQTVVFPGVAVGDARLRISVSSEHTTEDLDLAAEILVDAAREVNLPVAA